MNRRNFLSQAATLVAAGAVIPRALAAAGQDAPPAPASGMTYAPKGAFRPVVKPGEFPIGVAHLDHGHIYGMCNGLTEAGATVKWVFDPDEAKVRAFTARYPQARVARSLDEILADPGRGSWRRRP
jgi:hypothetical protein